ncbi:ectonucleoside triphosphate diphosphohydrolase 3 isoform X2 [Thalassophryne amazonica]|uniref:ectonucleoside triphosphate diphosphohydrolase 3 isoform X2 n=1 Tax=Thalassophryne amazonica TaxID=390379 RepID=UPI00147170DD|nr:ectonucleoside triphosphate diphosphohydrolase 3 isoform X2 [Thalassophryne amazonica]
MGSKQKMGFKCRIAVVLLLLLASIAALVTIAVIQDTWRSKKYTLEYGIVIDAGSSRSNVFLYEWPGEKQNDTGVVEEKRNCKVKGPGISEMHTNAKIDEEIWGGFRNCMEEIKEAIPVEKHQTTLLFLGATAGMRLLQDSNEQRSKKILESLQAYLTSLPFKFQNASIITGQEEGLYGWITVNYLMGNFLEKNILNAYVRPKGAETVGSMDLGGASTQIAFAVQDGLSGPDFLPVKLYGYPYNVYTHSYLCYGKNEAEKKIMDKIIQESHDPSYISNPCYAEGFNTTITASKIYNTVCIKKPSDYKPDQEYFLVGSPNSDKCRRIVKSIFDFRTCSTKNCSFNGVEQPQVTGNFMAYAGFYFTSRALLMNGSSELNDFNNAIKEFCQTRWTVLKEERPKIAERFLHNYCTDAHYIFTLLTDGYKFDDKTWKNINFQREAGSQTVEMYTDRGISNLA